MFYKSRLNENVSVVTVFLLFLLLTLIRGEFENTRICHEEEKCIQMNNIWLPVCHCDRDCEKYSDCCSDNDTALSPPGHSCKNIPRFGWTFLVTACPLEWQNDITRKQCEKIPDSDQDPMTKDPVTHKLSGVTYANIFCAACHGHDYLPDISFWPMKLNCPGLFADINMNVFNHVTFDDNMKAWGATMNGVFIPCYIQISLLEPSPGISLKSCFQVAHNCSDNRTNNHDTDKNYVSMYDSSTFSLYYTFINETCDLHSLNHLSCLHTRWTDFETGRGDGVWNNDEIRHIQSHTHSFPILFDFKFSENNVAIGKKISCENSNQVYDPFFQKCREIIILTNTSQTAQEYESKSFNTNINCSRVYLESHEYTVSSDNLTVYVKEYNRTFTNTEFTIMDDYHIEICAFPDEVNTTSKFSAAMRYTTLAGLGISILFLILHLCAFIFCQELRKLSDKNLASLCLALLSCYTIFIIMTEIVEAGYWWCSTIGFIMYFTLMSVLTWSLVIGFDIWKALHLATTKFKLISGKQNVKFFFYSLFSWAVPLIMVLFACLLEILPSEWPLKPQIGEYSCWFGSRYALFVLLAVPSGVIMFLNFIFICWSIYFIIVTRNNAKNTAQHSAHLYIRLVIIMGLSWSFGIAAGYFDSEIIWYIFIICNTFQGLFIFIAFTCRRRILRNLKSKLRFMKYINTSTTKTSTRQDTFTQKSSSACK